MVKKRKASLTSRPSSGKGRGRGGAGAKAPAETPSRAQPDLELLSLTEVLTRVNRQLSIVAHNLRHLVRVASQLLAAPKSHPQVDASQLSLLYSETIDHNNEVTRPVYAADDGREEGDIPTCDADLAAHLFGDGIDAE